MIMKRTLLVIALLSSGITFAADFKLGYIDVTKVFTTSKPAVALQNSLKTKFIPQQQELQKMNTNLTKEGQQIQAIENKAPSMDKLSPADKTKLIALQTQYQKDQMAFQQKYTTYQQTIQKYQDYASALLLGKANIILKDISEKGGFDLVLTSNQLVYAKPKYDLTDQVVEQLKTVDVAALLKQLDAADKQNVTESDLAKIANPNK